MGQKVNPEGLRVGVIKDWNSKWYADSKHFGDYLVEDHKIREYIKKKLYVAGIAKIEVERTAKFVKVTVGKAGSLSVRSKAGKGVGFVARSTQSVNKYGEKRGFRFRYSTSKKMKSAKYKTTGLAKNVYTKTGLKKGKKYYVQVRYYYYDSTNQKVYGAYSNVKSVKAN